MRPAKETDQTSSRLKVRYSFDASRTDLFKAFTDPGSIRRWFVPTPGFSVVEVRVDARVGGAFRFTVATPAGETNHINGTYQQVEPPAKLVFSWRWEGALDIGESLVTVEFRPKGDATEVVITHEGLPDEQMVQFHSFGWESALKALAQQL